MPENQVESSSRDEVLVQDAPSSIQKKTLSELRNTYISAGTDANYPPSPMFFSDEDWSPKQDEWYSNYTKETLHPLNRKGNFQAALESFEKREAEYERAVKKTKEQMKIGTIDRYPLMPNLHYY